MSRTDGAGAIAELVYFFDGLGHPCAGGTRKLKERTDGWAGARAAVDVLFKLSKRNSRAPVDIHCGTFFRGSPAYFALSAPRASSVIDMPSDIYIRHSRNRGSAYPVRRCSHCYNGGLKLSRFRMGVALTMRLVGARVLGS